ncbi:hypothetical protein [Pseudomonas faucium]|uniref:hypothetical protein n=1 Tax=Pseudomonas faucium TaxID=2740518 RepID=UPI0039C28C09
MSEINETIASLRSSIEVLHNLATTLQMQISSKAESSFVAELASRVTACEGQVTLSTAQVRAVSSLTSRVTDLLDQIKVQLSESQLATELESKITLVEQGQAKQGSENRAVNDRLAVVELNRVSQKGLDEAAAVRTAQRIDALQAQIEILQGKIENRG